MALALNSRRSVLPEVRRAEFERVVLAAEGDKTIFVHFDEGSEEDGVTAQALADAERQHAGKIKALSARAADFQDYFAELTAKKRAFDSYDFTRRPAVALYRKGRLVTTLHPRRVFYIGKLQAREVRTQLDTFIEKFVDFDPNLVREQTNLDVVQQHKETGQKP